MSWFWKLFRSESKPATITVGDVTYDVCDSVDALTSAIETEGRGAIRFPTSNYGDILYALMDSMKERHGESSPQYSDVIPSEVVCAKCHRAFGDMHRVSMQRGGLNQCPRCGGPEAILIYEPSITGEKLSETQVQAIKMYCRHRAERWWKKEKMAPLNCDGCHALVDRDAGYVHGNTLLCDECMALRISNCDPHDLAILLRDSKRFLK
jgi:hypothetical protein